MVFFDCEDDDDGSLSNTLPCGYNASWQHFGIQFWWSLVVYFSLFLLCFFYNSYWEKIKVCRWGLV
jgi:hypothetical protein